MYLELRLPAEPGLYLKTESALKSEPSAASVLGFDGGFCLEFGSFVWLHTSLSSLVLARL